MKSSYRLRWGHERKRMLKGHPKREDRYQRAIDRITPERRKAIEARALKELGLVAYPHYTHDIVRVDALIAQKLGIRTS